MPILQQILLTVRRFELSAILAEKTHFRFRLVSFIAYNIIYRPTRGNPLGLS